MANKEDTGALRRKEDYETVFSTDAGQRVIADLMSKFNIGRSSHTPGDPYETAFREGERHVVMNIIYMLGKRSDPQWVSDKLDQGEIEYSIIQEFS